MPRPAKARVMNLLRRSYDIIFDLERTPPYTRVLRQWVSDTSFLIYLGLGVGSPLLREFRNIRYYPSGHFMDKATAYLPSTRLWAWYWALVGDPGPKVQEAYHQGFAQAKSVLWNAIQEIDRTWPDDPPDDDTGGESSE